MFMVYYLDMLKVNVSAVKAQLSEYLDRMERGERVIICRRNRPVAELRPIAAARVEPRPLGGAKGQLTLARAFFEPLPEEIVDSFAGGLAYATSAPTVRQAWVAKETPPHATPKTKSPARRRKSSRSRRS